MTSQCSITLSKYTFMSPSLWLQVYDVLFYLTVRHILILFVWHILIVMSSLIVSLHNLSVLLRLCYITWMTGDYSGWEIIWENILNGIKFVNVISIPIVCTLLHILCIRSRYGNYFFQIFIPNHANCIVEIKRVQGSLIVFEFRDP